MKVILTVDGRTVKHQLHLHLLGHGRAIIHGQACDINLRVKCEIIRDEVFSGVQLIA